MSTIHKVKISLDKRYDFSDGVKYITPSENVNIAIIPQFAKWIVLNDIQLRFFKLLEFNTIAQALNIFGNETIAKQVLIDIEGRRFFENNGKRISQGAFTLHFSLTNGCNLRCPHCYLSAGVKYDDELTTDEIKSVLSEFKNIGGKRVIFTGGEVAMLNNFTQIVEYAHELDLKIQILSNGILWNKKLIETISPLIDLIQISIDGYDEDSNKVIRGSGNFGLAMATVKEFLSRGVDTIIAITPSIKILDSIEEINAYADFARKLCEAFVEYKNNFNIRFTLDLMDGRELKLTKKERVAYYNATMRIYSSYYGVESRNMPFVLQRRSNQLLDNCSFGDLAITPNGEIYFCTKTTSCASIGNIRNLKFSYILEQSLAAKRLSNIDNLLPCKNCDLRYICGGGCKVDFFPTFTQVKDFISIDRANNGLITRNSCQEYHRIIDLMIETNKYLNQ